MKKKASLIFTVIISFFILILSSCPTDGGDPGIDPGTDPGTDAEASELEFWGYWVRLDEGESWYITDESARVTDSGGSSLEYGVEKLSDTSLEVDGRTLILESGNVVSIDLGNNEKGYLYRNGGANNRISGQVRSMSAGSSSVRGLNVSNLGGVDVVLQNINNNANRETDTTDTEGQFEMTQVIPGDSYTLEVEDDPSTPENEGLPPVEINPREDGENVGVLIITDTAYNFKTRLIGLDEEFLWADGRNYEVTLSIENIGSGDCRSPLYEISSPDGLTVAAGGSEYDLDGIFNTIEPGVKVSIPLTISSSVITDDYEDLHLKISVEDYDRNVFEDTITLRFYRETMTYEFRALNRLSGVVLSPEKKSWWFDIPSAGTTTVEVPYRSDGYVVVATCPTAGDEGKYSIGIDASAPSASAIEAVEDRDVLWAYEDNDGESNAALLSIGGTAIAYTTKGDLDYYAVTSIENFTYELTVSDDGNGTTDPSGAVTVMHGEAENINAEPSNGFAFESWSITEGTGAVVTSPASASTTVTLTSEDAEVTAEFVPAANLTLQAGTGGTVSENEPVFLKIGEAFSINCTPASGFIFNSWSVEIGAGAVIADNQEAGTEVTLSSGDVTLQANFLPLYTLTIGDDGNGSTLPDGDLVLALSREQDISASPSYGYDFSEWAVISGSPEIIDSESAATTLTMGNGDTSIEARFVLKTYSLTVSKNVSDRGTVDPDGTVSVTHGIVKTVTASSLSGYAFINWSVESGINVDIVDDTLFSTDITLTGGDAEISANFLPVYSLSIGSAGNGTAEITGDSEIIQGYSETVSATPSSGYVFKQWQVSSGSGVNIADMYDSTTTVTLNSTDATVTAYFTVEYNIGDRGPANGWIFYDSGSYHNGWRYMEVADSDQFTGTNWGPDIPSPNTISQEIGDGLPNTQAIFTAFGNNTFYPNYAAKICYNLILNGYSDWFLPSKGEFELIVTNVYNDVSISDNFSDTVFGYWTSSEINHVSKTSAHTYSFMFGNFSLRDKQETNYNVRAARRF
ncbi:MAG: hypothetical protein JEY99_21425 [Spirochaetales bacterium]|nr:hypothetical protein [Spirochaetales bacterium]